MKKCSLFFVMFVLVQIIVAGLLFGDDVRAAVANGPSGSGIAKGPVVATSLTPVGPVKSEDKGQPRRRAGTPPKVEPELQFEGTITAASATSITVHDSHGKCKLPTHSRRPSRSSRSKAPSPLPRPPRSPSMIRTMPTSSLR